MKAAKAISVILWLVIIQPIWFYLLYKILQSVNASELMWFLYWVYIPIGIIIGIISQFLKIEE